MSVTYVSSDEGSAQRVEIELPIQEDVEQELADFTHLVDRGSFVQARDLFDQILWSQLHLFPVLAEYLNCLLQQGDYEPLEGVLAQVRGAEGIRKFELLPEEMQVIQLTGAVCELHRFGRLSKALETARMWHQQVAHLSLQEYSAIQLRFGHSSL